MQYRFVGKAIYFVPVALMLGCAAPASTAAVSDPDYQSQINSLRREIAEFGYQISGLQSRIDQQPKTTQVDATPGLGAKIDDIKDDIRDIKSQLGSLTNRVTQIGQVTDDVCFKSQPGGTVIRPCRQP